MKSTTLFTALTLAAVTPFVFADNCNKGVLYCGYTLLNKGNYYSQIVGALSTAGSATDEVHVQQTLFYCVGGNNGDITFQGYCPAGCVDGGAGNDHC